MKLYGPMLSPLQLDRYFLKGLHFELKDGYDRDTVPGRFEAPQLEIGVVSAEQDEEQPSHWRFEVNLELPDLPDSEFPYQTQPLSLVILRWTKSIRQNLQNELL